MTFFKKNLLIFSACFFLFNLTLIKTSIAQDLQQEVQEIQKELENIRGEKFKHPIMVKKQSLADFGKYIDKQMSEQYPEIYLKNYGRIVKKLGLYTGPEITNYKELAKMVVQSQAAAYYDPATKTFYVVMQNLPDIMQKTVYAHELYHGFQDQYFDLKQYYLSQTKGKLNDDELLARQAVVEGEATYIMTLWSLKHMMGQIPDASFLDMSIKMQANLDVKQLLNMVKSGAVPQLQKGDMENAVKAMDNIPPFILETMVGAYLKGLNFINDIHKNGWAKVAELYRIPPASSEQILHPSKWLQHENPARIHWQNFRKNKLFAGWTLLEKNTVGEFQWRIIFSEFKMQDDGLHAAAGWNGDRFAVLQNKHNPEDLLLLLYTTWDSEKDAQEFTQAYKQLLKLKYPEHDETSIVKKTNKDVFIVEGGKPSDSQQYLRFIQHAIKSKHQ